MSVGTKIQTGLAWAALVLAGIWLIHLPAWINLVTVGAIAPLNFLSYLAAASTLGGGGIAVIAGRGWARWLFAVHIMAAVVAAMVLPLLLDAVFKLGILVSLAAFANYTLQKQAPLGANEDELLNFALHLAQEWGENWLMPIQGRLRESCPGMSAAELDRLNAIAQSAMKAGHDLVAEMAGRLARNEATMEQWRQEYLSRFPWVNEDNLGRLFSTGMYYAMK